MGQETLGASFAVPSSWTHYQELACGIGRYRKFPGQYLSCFGSYPENVFFHITAPMEDGIFEFSPAKSRASGEMAEYLRKRFRLGESKK